MVVNNYSLPLIELTDAQRLWMEKVYEKNKRCERFSVREIWATLHDKLPANFHPRTINPKLINSDGDKINVLGVIAIEKKYNVIDEINRVIFAIREMILIDPKLEIIQISSVAERVELSAESTSFLLQLASEFGQFYRSCSSDTNNFVYKSIDIGSDQSIYYRYLQFTGIEKLIKLKEFESFRDRQDDFTVEEMISSSKKIDQILEELQVLKLGHEILWTDLMNELNELKAYYSLSKKNWRQLLTGKLAEMVAGGIISETISKKIADFINPVITRLLT